MQEKIISGRDMKLDNIKGLLMFLVVFGHFIGEEFNNGDLIGWVYSTIYVFHMPLFVFVNGYLGKKFKFKSLINLFLVYCLWQVIIYPLAFSILRGV